MRCRNFIYSILLFLSLLLFTSYAISSETVQKEVADENENTVVQSASEQLYEEMNLEGVIAFEVFDKAYEGYTKLNVKNKDILSIIDFSLPSSKKRLYILDINKKQLLFESYVSHGRNSGELYATNFSNKHGSYKSSLGFYETENTYNGKNGYSLILNGLERGINDQAKARAIVMHGADYCNPSIIKSSGRLGRSFGCPSVPRELTKPIINTIKNGSLLFIYADDDKYLATSQILSDEESSPMLSSNI